MKQAIHDRLWAIGSHAEQSRRLERRMPEETDCHRPQANAERGWVEDSHPTGFDLDPRCGFGTMDGVKLSSPQFASNVAGWYYFTNAAGWRLRLC